MISDEDIEAVWAGLIGVMFDRGCPDCRRLIREQVIAQASSMAHAHALHADRMAFLQATMPDSLRAASDLLDITKRETRDEPQH